MKNQILNGVPHFHIAKPFYKTYLYKLEYDFGDKSAPVWTPSGFHRTDSRRREVWNKARAFSRAVKRFAVEQNIDIRTRVENSRVGIFVQTEKSVSKILEKFPQKLTSIWEPYNQAQVVMIGNDLNATLIFRPNLFCASNLNPGYRYKIQCRISNEIKSQWETINNFIKGLQVEDFKVNDHWFKIPKNKMNYWNTFSMYFNDEQDIMMFKLIVGSTNFSLTKAVLYSELE